MRIALRPTVSHREENQPFTALELEFAMRNIRYLLMVCLPDTGILPGADNVALFA